MLWESQQEMHALAEWKMIGHRLRNSEPIGYIHRCFNRDRCSGDNVRSVNVSYGVPMVRPCDWEYVKIFHATLLLIRAWIGYMDERLWRRCVRETNQMAEKLLEKICPKMWKNSQERGTEWRKKGKSWLNGWKTSGGGNRCKVW